MAVATKANDPTIAETAVNTFIKDMGGHIAAQLDACTRCGLCAEACHFYLTTGKPEYTPIYKVDQLERAYRQNFTAFGKIKTTLGLEKPVSTEDILEWTEYDFEACTECHRCTWACPMGIDIAELIHEARVGMSRAGLIPEGLRKRLDNQLANGHPSGKNVDEYLETIRKVEQDYDMSLPMDQDADVLVVFTTNELWKFPSNVAAIAKILNAGGVSWTLSSKGREVMNFGLINGLEEREKEISEILINAAQNLNAKRLMITECGHAYENLRWRVEELLGRKLPFEVIHITEMIGELLKNKKIKVREGVIDDGITFHDSCKIQRMGGNFDQPRMALNQLAGDKFIEMTPNREATLCCGGGNGITAIPSATATRHAAFTLKIDQVERTGAKKVAMTCTSCRLQFLDGVKHFDLDWEILSLAQLVADNLIEA